MHLPELAERVRAEKLVVLAGAGVSMLPPTALPNWRDFNRAVIEALGARVGEDTIDSSWARGSGRSSRFEKSSVSTHRTSWPS